MIKYILNLLFKLKYYKLYKNNIYVHPFSFISKYTYIDIGTRINGPAYIAGQKDAHVSIGKYCAIAYGLRIRARNHSISYPNMQNSLLSTIGISAKYDIKKETKIGNACWIGDNVIILPGVTIGNGAVIGAGSIITKDIPPFAVAVGIPAEIIKYRFNKKVIKQIEELKWWDWSISKMKKNKHFFNMNLNEVDNLDKVEFYE